MSHSVEWPDLNNYTLFIMNRNAPIYSLFSLSSPFVCPFKVQKVILILLRITSLKMLVILTKASHFTVKAPSEQHYEGYRRAPAIALLFSFAYKLSAGSKHFLTH